MGNVGLYVNLDFEKFQFLFSFHISFGSKISNNDSVSTSPKDDEADKVYDKISSIVRKEIRSNHILLQGRKELIYEGGKHLIEVSSLINRKDVSPEDTVDSNKILQITIRVLR